MPHTASLETNSFPFSDTSITTREKISNELSKGSKGRKKFKSVFSDCFQEGKILEKENLEKLRSLV